MVFRQDAHNIDDMFSPSAEGDPFLERSTVIWKYVYASFRIENTSYPTGNFSLFLATLLAGLSDDVLVLLKPPLCCVLLDRSYTLFECGEHLRLHAKSSTSTLHKGVLL